MFADRTNWNLSPNRLSEALAQHKAAGKPLIDLTVSNPTECGFEYDREAILNALANPAALAYEPNPKGLESARLAVAGYYASKEVEVPVDDILLTASTSEAYSFVFKTLCNFGDEVLIPVPSYPLFSFLADVQDVKLVHYPLIYDHGWQIDFHSLEQAITPRSKAVMVVHPNNPTGHYCKASEMARLNEVCLAKELAIIADEVFLDFALTAEQPASFAANRQALTFTMSGLSKICGLPQMKAAWLVVNGPKQLKKQALDRLEVIADTFLSVSTPVQLALPSLLSLRRSFQAQLLARVRANLQELDRQLASPPNCFAPEGYLHSEVRPHCTRLALEGGWYTILRVPATRSDEDLALDLLQTHGIYIHPGHYYDLPSGGHLVVSLICPQVKSSLGIGRLIALS
jgi:alanine-synthesizing transaminase